MQRKVIGQGTFGCVLKPSIHCKTPPTPNFDYSNYVSKLMLSKHAIKELNEFLVVAKYDTTNEYYLGKPTLCKPDLSDQTVKNDIIQGCKHINKDDITNNPDKFDILLVENGGYNLTDFCKFHLGKYVKNNKEQKIDTILLEFHRLLRGLNFFRKNGLVHNDLKPQNILFDPEKEVMKYIDFGLMNTRHNLISFGKKNTNRLAIYHWSFPLECPFANKSKFEQYKDFTKTSRDDYFSKLNKLLTYYTNTIPDKELANRMLMKNPYSFDLVFSYLDTQNKIPSPITKVTYLNTFRHGLDTLVDNYSFDQAVEMIIDSIDLYGLGFSLMHVVNVLYSKSHINDFTYFPLRDFFMDMCCFNIELRTAYTYGQNNDNLSNLLTRYENILLLLGVSTRNNLSFDPITHEIIHKPPLDKSILNLNNKYNRSSNHSLSDKIITLANEDIQLCPESKELNPKTNKCVDKCKPDYRRDLITGKCKKNATERKCPETKELNPTTNRCVYKCDSEYSRDLITGKCKKNATKKCPETKELNPLTNRCLYKCKPDYTRDKETGKCKKTGTKRNATKRNATKRNVKEKKCPETKELNPLTNRCVNKCKPDYIHNAKFKCVKMNGL
jgi:serine/threonine protein kinase